jgi:hypothetical protein
VISRNVSVQVALCVFKSSALDQKLQVPVFLSSAFQYLPMLVLNLCSFKEWVAPPAYGNGNVLITFN